MIRSIHATQRLDSRGNPTVQVDLTTGRGTFRAIVPSGASTGAKEAIELRDGDKSAYGGHGVQKAVSNVELIIGPALVRSGLNVDTGQEKIDQLLENLDGTKNKAKLGANAILGVSMACARAGAAHSEIPLYEFLRRESGAQKPFIMPVPFFNVLNGGVHSGNKMAFQETMIAPVGASSFTEAVRMGSEVYQQLKKVIVERFGSSAAGIGVEGGFAPPISQPHEALDLLVQAVCLAGYTGSIKFAIDPASSGFYWDGNYDLGFKDKKPNVQSPRQLTDLIIPLSFWRILSPNLIETAGQIELVGDDLLVTNTQYVQEAYEKKACNSMLLKINQIGTISEAIEAANLAYTFDWSVFVSHRSGETTDDFIADLAVDLRTGHLKAGAPCRGERIAKYNRLMDIEADILRKGEKCIYAGSQFGAASKC
ncbi:hypothetical protein N7451_005754 [Penicillium sp. IBT 35674x]|nr:hypothetical protein N7451_005754 [Penicillium sp. IBT 35674x]